MELQSNVIQTKKKMHRKRRRFERDLPTPPPDPQEELIEELINEALPIIENNNNLSHPGFDQAPTIPVPTTASLSVGDAFEHLSKLYGLIDEILNLRDRNSKHFRRIRELEKIKALKKANTELEKHISNGHYDIHGLDEDVGFAESLLGAMLSSGFELLPRRSSNISRATSSAARRSGSLSSSIEQRRVSCPVAVEMPRRSFTTGSASALANTIAEKKRASLVLGQQPKVSKWTRVKAAFKWERAACNTSDIGDAETIVRYLKIPDSAAACSEITSGPPTPVGTISSSSSIDDVFHKFHRPVSQSLKAAKRDEIPEHHDSDVSRRSQSLDGEIIPIPISLSFGNYRNIKDNYNSGKIDYRSHKTPWGKMKDMIQLRRDSLARQTSRRNDDNHSTSSLESNDVHRFEEITRVPRVRITSDPSTSSTLLKKTGQNTSERTDLASRRLQTPTLTITVPSSEELRNISSPESITPPLPPYKPCSESEKSDRSSHSGMEMYRDKNGQMSHAGVPSSGLNIRHHINRSKINQGTLGNFKRQPSVKGNSLGSSPRMPRRDSKWNKVKRAFLTSATSVPTSPNKVSSYFFDDGEAAGSYSASASAENLDDPISPSAQAQIQRNYRLLHDKLGSEFYRKLTEWEKLKSSSTSPNLKESLSAKHQQTLRDRETDNFRLLSEDQLTPQFRKKLDEWKRIGFKTHVNSNHESRPIGKRRITDWQLWRSHSKVEGKLDSPGKISEDFMKKMEEWKKIKSSVRRDDDHDVKKTLETEDEAEDDAEHAAKLDDVNMNDRAKDSDSKLSTKFKTWKGLENEEFKPLEKVLNAMEIERQTRLSKLHRVVGAPENTQEVLIHTSTGIYRFEGISRNFTRKLYEWEKSQGISPDLSTFRFLDPLPCGISFNVRTADTRIQMEKRFYKRLSRSKSVGNLRMESWDTTNDKSMDRRPSSLSLNDMENLDARSCIVASSIPTIGDEEDTSEEAMGLEDLEDLIEPELEPEAMIVDIEDVIEETASPLTKYQPHQTPVYSVAGSETTSIAIPLGTVTTRHELSSVLLVEPNDETHQPITVACAIEGMAGECYNLTGEMDKTTVVETYVKNDNASKSKDAGPDDHSRTVTTRPTEDIEVNPKNIDGNPVDEWKITHLNYSEDEDALTEVVITVACNSRQKRQGLKTRRLTDSQVGYKWRQNNGHLLSNAEKESPKNSLPFTPTVVKDQREGMTSACHEDNLLTKTSTSSTATITSTKSDFVETNTNREKIKINETTLNKIVVPTSSGTITTSDSHIGMKVGAERLKRQHSNTSKSKERRDPRNMLIKTKRIVFSPFKRDSKGKSESESESPTSKTAFDNHNGIKDEYENTKINSSCPDTKPVSETKKEEVKRLSIPRSPILTRKEYKMSSPKETAPSIRMMIKKYNEKLETSTGFATQTGSTTSSGSNSPIWRSPVTERRITGRLEKYQEEVRKAVAGPIYQKNYPSGISKSATVDFPVKNSTIEDEKILHSIVKSETVSEIGNSKISAFRPEKELDKNFSSTSLRALMIQKAKEDFFLDKPFKNSSKIDDSDIDNINNSNNNKNNSNNKSANDSIDKHSSGKNTLRSVKNHEPKKRRVKPEELQNLSRLDLVKSASAGMINVDSDTFGRLDLSTARGCDSLPRSSEQWRQQVDKCTKESSNTSRFHQLANKFRRAKLRKSKEKDIGSMSTVSMLCRQSLLVDIAGTSKSCPTTPSPQFYDDMKSSQKF